MDQIRFDYGLSKSVCALSVLQHCIVTTGSLVIIICLTQILSLVLGRIRQPRVIAEVIGGIILGPTVMGRIPGFQANIFPDQGMPLLNITSTVGLIFFLFLVGLEVDTRIVKRNMAASVAVSVAGLIVPLGLGAALGVGIYREFIDPSVNFGYFLLFVAVAIGITAFPVLCRILTELKLLDTTVGVVTLAAGVGNDVIGWILLALTVALVNASSGLTALWVLLVCVGYVLVLLYPGRWAYVWFARRTGSLEQGSPTTTMMTVTLLVVLVSAFFTDIIGIHAIFGMFSRFGMWQQYVRSKNIFTGGFLAGLIVPHENGFAISLVEKLEDLVSIIFIPVVGSTCVSLNKFRTEILDSISHFRVFELILDFSTTESHGATQLLSASLHSRPSSVPVPQLRFILSLIGGKLAPLGLL